MVDRIMMTPTRTAISKPTIDVKTADSDDLLFDTNSAKLNVLFTGKTFTTNNDSRSGVRDVTYPGGKVFSKAPFAFLGWGNQGTYYPPVLAGSNNGWNITSPPGATQFVHMNFGKSWNAYAGNGGGLERFPNNSATAYWFAIYTMADRIRVQWWYNPSDNDWAPDERKGPGNFSFYYAVVDFTGGGDVT